MSEIEKKNTKMDIEAYLDAVEEYVQKKFMYRSALSDIIRQSTNNGMEKEFEDLIFLGKFISSAHSILKRAGSDSSDTIKLAAEFQKSLERSVELLKRLIQGAPDNIRKKIESDFLAPSHHNLHKILDLMYELSRIKNYSLDRKNSSKTF